MALVILGIDRLDRRVHHIVAALFKHLGDGVPGHARRFGRHVFDVRHGELHVAVSLRPMWQDSWLAVGKEEGI